jgi:hypothetical protein
MRRYSSNFNVFAEPKCSVAPKSLRKNGSRVSVYLSIDGERGTAVSMPGDDHSGAVCIMIGDK